jgi:hypothetical protein
VGGFIGSFFPPDVCRRAPEINTAFKWVRVARSVVVCVVFCISLFVLSNIQHSNDVNLEKKIKSDLNICYLTSIRKNKK